METKDERCNICGNTQHYSKDCTRPKEPRKAPPEPSPKVKPERPTVSASDASQELTKEEKEFKEFISKLNSDDSQKGESLKMLMQAYKKDDPQIKPSTEMMRVNIKEDEDL